MFKFIGETIKKLPMKKTFSMLLLAAAALFLFAGCRKENRNPDTEPADPGLELSLKGTTGNSVTFVISYEDSEMLAYILSDDEMKDPSYIFENGEVVGPLDGKDVERTVDNLEPDRSYTLYAVSSCGDVYSDIEKLPFTTGNAEVKDVVSITDVTKYSYSFVVNAPEGKEFKYAHLPKKFLEQLYEASEDETEEEKERGRMWYLSHYGIKASGTVKVDVVDNETYTDYDGSQYVYEIYGSTEYVAMAVFYGDDGKFVEPVYMDEVKLPEAGVSGSKIQCSVVGEPTATDVHTLCEPDSDILYFKQLVMLKEKYDEYVAENGLEAMKYMVGNDDRSARCTGRTEDHWEGLQADTEYIMCILGIDSGHDQLWVDDFVFRTAKPEEKGAVEMTASAGDPSGYYSGWNSVNFSIKSKEIVTPSWYYFGQTSVVERLLADGLDYEEIAMEKGVSIIPIFINKINEDTGWQVVRGGEDMRPDVSYTLFVVLTHSNGEVLVERADVKTEKMPEPERSESSLFSELVGEWTATFEADVMGEASRLTFDVTISDGGEFVDMCRPYNRLMCTGFAGIEYRSPEDLRNDTSDDSYWKDVPEDIFYDFGPKWFLEIDPDGNVTLPTDAATVPYLMNYDINADPVSLAVTGAYMTRKPCPVEVSEDRNTITVKPYYDEYMAMNFYLCMAEGFNATVVLKSDMVLTRKQ